MNTPPDAVILSAGFGKRLRPLTLKTPKPLIKVNGKPLILYAMESLFSAGVGRFLINAHYLPHRILNFLQHVYGIPLVFSRERVLLGTGGGIKQFEEFLTEIFFVHNSDIIHSIDLSIPFRQFVKSDAIGMLILKKDYRNTVLVEGGRVVGIGEGDNAYTYTGISIFRKDFLRFLPEKGSLVEGMLSAIESGYEILAHITDAPWRDMGVRNKSS